MKNIRCECYHENILAKRDENGDIYIKCRGCKKVINVSTEKEEIKKSPGSIGDNYFICRSDKHGNEIFRENITDDHHIETFCLMCDQKLHITMNDFINYTFDFEVCPYSNRMYCEACSIDGDKELSYEYGAY